MLIRKAKKLDSAALFEAGTIIPRSETFFQRVQMFALPTADHEMLLRRIEALVPQEIAIERFIQSDGQIIYCAPTWKAKLVESPSFTAPTGETWQAYEFWFDASKNKTNYQAMLQMNVLLTAVEKAFLLADPRAVVHAKYATALARDFEMGPEGDGGTALFDIAEFAEFSPFSLALKAAKFGTEAASDVFDSMQTKDLNRALAEMNATDILLIERYRGMPALPDKLRALLESNDALADHDASAGPIL